MTIRLISRISVQNMKVFWVLHGMEECTQNGLITTLKWPQREINTWYIFLLFCYQINSKNISMKFHEKISNYSQKENITQNEPQNMQKYPGVKGNIPQNFIQLSDHYSIVNIMCTKFHKKRNHSQEKERNISKREQ